MAEADFNAANRELTIPNGVLKYERTQAWTMRADFKHGLALPDPSFPSLIMGNVGNGPEYPGYELLVNDQGKLHVRLLNNFDTPDNFIGKYGSTDVTDDAWHCVVATYDGSSTAAGVKIYLDGVEESYTVESGTLSATIVPGAANLHIGNHHGLEANCFFPGKLRTVVLYNAVKDASWRTSYGTSGTVPPVDANTALQLDFDDVRYLWLTDLSSNGYHGYLSTSNILPDTSDLYDNLISVWHCDETSGNAIDSWGDHDLTEQNTPTAAAGKVNGARDCEFGSSEYFSHADHADFSPGTRGLTVAGWVQFESLGAYRAQIGKDNATNSREFGLFYDSAAARMAFYASADGTNVVQATANAFGAISTGVWYFVVGWFDPALGVIGISVNGNATTAALTAMFAGTSQLTLGALQGAVVSHDGLLDEWALWQRTLSSAHQAELYNSGNGMALDDPPEAAGIGLKLARLGGRPRFRFIPAS